jgi:hypothetical protein
MPTTRGRKRGKVAMRKKVQSLKPMTDFFFCSSTLLDGRRRKPVMLTAAEWLSNGRSLSFLLITLIDQCGYMLSSSRVLHLVGR